MATADSRSNMFGNLEHHAGVCVGILFYEWGEEIMIDMYIYVIVALLPLSAVILLLQVNPYNALVVRGILGAVAAMLYSLLGAADVALTEALVGTMLAITLYAIAVRSSLVMRLGIIEETATEAEGHFQQLINELRKIFSKRQMRLELVPYPNTQALERALMDKEIHGMCFRQECQEDKQVVNNTTYTPSSPASESQLIAIPVTQEEENLSYHTAIRVKRIYDILGSELSSPETSLSYVNTPAEGEKHQ